MYACDNGNIKLVTKLIEMGSNLNLITKRKNQTFYGINNVISNSALSIAAINKHYDLVDTLFFNKGADYSIDVFGDPFISWASREGQYKIVEALLRKGVNPNIRDDFDSWTPIMTAAKFGNAEIIKLLVQYGGNVNLKAGRDNALSLANEYPERPEVIKVLIGYGAKLPYRY
jgi:ankyrin repeat protein